MLCRLQINRMACRNGPPARSPLFLPVISHNIHARIVHLNFIVLKTVCSLHFAPSHAPPNAGRSLAIPPIDLNVATRYDVVPQLNTDDRGVNAT